MVSAALLSASTEAAEVVLYDFTDFAGEAITLTASAPDLDAFGFDNEVESIQVISGTWSFHRDDGFQNNNGPAIILGPGGYPNIEALGFPADRMSSVQLLQDTQPPPSQACVVPYQVADGSGGCLFTCAAGTFGNQASGECECLPGYAQTDVDAQGRRICGPLTGSPPGQGQQELQPPPVQEAHWINVDGFQINGGAPSTDQPTVTLSAQFSTSSGIGPGPIEYRAIHSAGAFITEAQALQALAGAPWQTFREPRGFQPVSPLLFPLPSGQWFVYFQLRVGVTSSSGGLAWIESNIRAAEILNYSGLTTVQPGEGGVAPATEDYVVTGDDAYAEASASGFAFRTTVSGSVAPATTCSISGSGQALFNGEPVMTLRSVVIAPPVLVFQATCTYEVFADNRLQPGWTLVDADWEVRWSRICGNTTIQQFAQRARTMSYRITVPLAGTQECDVGLHAITLRGPAGADWRDAF